MRQTVAQWKWRQRGSRFTWLSLQNCVVNIYTMKEVNIENINELYPEIRECIKNARFISMDTEFTALYLSEDDKQSLFDTPNIRYEKLRKLSINTIPVQVGLTTFIFDSDKNCYNANCFVFYVWPKPFLDLNHKLLFHSSSFQFLCEHKFDFNKLIYKGLPFLDSIQEEETRKLLSNDENLFSFLNFDLESLINNLTLKISTWFYSTNNDTFVVYEGVETFSNKLEMQYLLHKHLRNRFQNKLWTYEENGQLMAKKVEVEEFKNLSNIHNLESETLNKALGFSRIFKLLLKYKKPLIGHNLYTDLLLMYNTFYKPLPMSYTKFKKSIHDLLPSIYDTKCLYYEIRRFIPQNKEMKLATLSDMYNYFKDSYGRHLSLNSPFIDLADKEDIPYDMFHDAGWDSYCTGYVFIRMAHIFATAPYKYTARVVTSTEHFAAVKEYKNYINLIRCTISHLRLDTDDPKSTRPPCLLAQSNNNENLDIFKLNSLLSAYGYVELKKFTNKKVLIAVSNHSSAKRILNQLGNKSDFMTIQKYSPLRHTYYGPLLFWGGVILAGTLLVGLANLDSND